MNDAEYESEKARVQRYIDKWFPLLHLYEWRRIRMEWFRDKNKAEWQSPDAEMEVSTLWQYAEAYLKIDLTETITESDDEIEFTILHEFCHILVAEMRVGLETRPAEEHVVTQLARAYLNTWNSARESQHEVPGVSSDPDPSG